MIKEAIALLGLEATDRVTGMKGAVTSVCFDLYGCVQAVLNTGLDKEGKPKDQFWMDIKRLEVSEKRVMAAPDYDGIKMGKETGAAEKPSLRGSV